jgi:hypothetical protein
MAKDLSDVLVAINSDPTTCRALAAGRAFRARYAELLHQEQRLNNVLARTPAHRRDKTRRVFGKQADRAARLVEQAAGTYSARLQLLPEDVQERICAAVCPGQPHP